MKILNSALLEFFLSSSGVCTDTRKIQAGNLFFALKGPNFNANALAKEALEKGALAAVIDDAAYESGDKTLLVEDGLKALQDLARDFRNTLSIPVIGLTGSNGKTTTKELLFSVLSQKFHCYATAGNLNNHIGVPLSILQIKPNHEVAVIEMGANKQGDIKELVEIAQPTHSLITNIGKAHLEDLVVKLGSEKAKVSCLIMSLNMVGQSFYPKPKMSYMK
jgi:UDP-N-acetylmuramoyl-tripeptide--D-alanyl-D-alanine ligase